MAEARQAVSALCLFLLAIAVSCEPHGMAPAFAVGFAPRHAARLFADPDPRHAVAKGLMRPHPRQAVREQPFVLRMAGNFSPGDKVIVKGKTGTLTEYKSSWWTVELDEGGEAKARASGLSPAVAGGKAPAKTPPAPTKRAAPSRRAGTGTTALRGSGTATRKGTKTATRDKPAAKAASRPAARPAPTAPPPTATIPSALRTVLQSQPLDDDSVVKYPDALANVFDAAEAEANGGGEAGAGAGAGARQAPYPAGLSRVLGPQGNVASQTETDGIEERTAGYPAGLAEVLDATEETAVAGKTARAQPAVPYPAALARILDKSGSSTSSSGATSAVRAGAAPYPPALSRVLDALQDAAEARPAASKTAARKGSATKTRGSSTVTRKRAGTTTKARGKGAAAAYPPALKAYLDLAAAAAKPLPLAPARPVKKPARAAYPPVLAALLAVAASPAAAQAAATRGVKRAASGSSTATRQRRAATSGGKPTRATYPQVLALLLAAAARPQAPGVGAGVGADVSADDAARLAVAYPDALAAYLDAMDVAGLPPSVPPPKRATYPVVLAEALGLGLNLAAAAADDDVTADLLAAAAAPDLAAPAAYPEALSRVIDASTPGDAAGAEDQATAAYPAALADLLDASEGTAGSGGRAGLAPSAATYPAVLAHLLDLSQWPSGRPLDEMPAAYPAALAELYLDAAEYGAAAAGEDPRLAVDAAASDAAGDKPKDLLSRFDAIAQNFAKKFGL